MSSEISMHVRSFIINKYADRLAAKGWAPESLPESFDLMLEGIVDSMEMVELIVAIEDEIGCELDFEKLEADQITVLGPLCDFVERQCTNEQE